MIKKNISAKELLNLYVESGVDEAIGNIPVDKYTLAESAEVQKTAIAESSRPNLQQEIKSKPVHVATRNIAETTNAAIKSAVELSAECSTLEELRKVIEDFDGCLLKATAMNTVFGAGSSEARVMFVGEAPGADEDRAGVPFVGESGMLLNKMIESIGLKRSEIYISNILPWRPPGNRKPTQIEMGICLPFIERHIELVSPNIIVLLGGSATSALLASNEGITRLRGKWFKYETPSLSSPIEAIPTFHPAYLLRTPAQKRKAWSDMLAIKKQMNKVSQ
ncbi:MAG: uracil-DNA glycosylase [Alphaproteobacteria bacterium]|nr:uracil-DNA glycosylase [Alphaproteobacteria bacterium]